ncbi:MAG: hypothetical protein ACKVP5_03355 [Aestuariivirga sp.]
MNSDLPGFVIGQVTENVYDTTPPRGGISSCPRARRSSANTTASSPSARNAP